MSTNYEKVMKNFMPAFRNSAANIMIKEYGIKQQQAAKILGTTQAAISKYLNSSQEGKYKDISIDSDGIRKFVERMRLKQSKNAQKVMCGMCQNNIKFNCAFMVK